MPWTAWYTTPESGRAHLRKCCPYPGVANPTLQSPGGTSNNKFEMPLSTPVRIHLPLSVDEADTLLQVLLEAPVPSDTDELQVNAILMRLAQALTSATNDRSAERRHRPVATCA